MNYYMAFYILIILCAVGGLTISYILINKKRKAKPIVCPLKGNCDLIVRGEYSKTFGISNEYLGVLYYLGMFTSYFLFFLIPDLIGTPFHILVILGSLGAFGFSLYLTFLQAFVIKQWCTYCLGSAFLTTLIAGFTMIGGGFDILMQLFFV